jgi:hypothetical protein
VPYDEAVFPERVKLDWFQNIWRWIGNSRQGSAPPNLLCNYEQVQASVSHVMRGESADQNVAR